MESKNSILTRNWMVAIGALVCCALWGSATPFIKMGYEHILPGEMKTTASTMLFAGTRFAIAGFLTIVIYSIARRRLLLPKPGNVGRILSLSAFQTVIQYFFFYVGLANTSGVKGTVLSGSSAFFAVLISALIFKQERLTVKKIVACIIGFAGIIVINLKGIDLNMNFTGDAFVLFSAISSAVSTVLVKRFSKHEDTVIMSGYQFLFGGFVLALVGALMGGRLKLATPEAFLILLYLSMLSAVAYALWGLLLKYNPVSKVSVYSFSVPVFGVLLSLLMLPESASVEILNLVITLILISTGVFLINYSKQKNK